MLANHPVAMMPHRELQTEALRRDAAAHHRSLDALRGRIRSEPPWQSPAPTPNRTDSGPRWQQDSALVLERAGGD